jgi:hypothetical protein
MTPGDWTKAITFGFETFFTSRLRIPLQLETQQYSDPDLCSYHSGMLLKVHKIEIFFGFDFEICNISLLGYVKILRFCEKQFLTGSVLGEVRFFRVVFRLRRMKKKFWVWSKKYFYFFSFMNPLYEPILVFPKFNPLTAPGMALRVDLGPNCQNLFCLVWD